MTIGDRLREERERLGLSQPKFAAIAGTTKQTLFSWETGKTAPDGFQMSALAEGGVDVLFVLTGQYVGDATPPLRLSRDEDELLAMYRDAPFAAKAAARGALEGFLGALEKGPRKVAKTSSPDVHIGNMTNHAPGGVQVGNAGGRVSIKRGN